MPGTDTGAGAHMESSYLESISRDGALAQLAELFPSTSASDLCAALEAYPGDLDAAAEYIVTGAVRNQSEGVGGARAPATPSSPARPRFSLDDDGASPATHASPAPPPPSAMPLQVPVRTSVSASAYQTPALAPARRPRSRPRAPRVDALDLAEIAATVRDIVVPALHAHFGELEFGDVREEGNGYAYSISEVRVVALSLPRENIIVRVVGNAVRVQVVNVFLQLDIGNWGYESRGFMPVKDSGRCEVSVNALSALATVLPKPHGEGDVRMVVADTSARIDGAIRLRAEGTVADWAYNAIAMLMKPLIASYIKDSVAELVRAALSAILCDWKYARTVDDHLPPRQSRVTFQTDVIDTDAAAAAPTAATTTPDAQAHAQREDSHAAAAS